MRHLSAGLSVLTLVSAFALPVIASYEAVYVTIICLLLLTIIVLSTDAKAAWNPLVKAFLAAAVLVSISSLLAGPTDPANWLGPAVILLPVLAVGFLLISKVTPGLSRTESIAALALIGVALGAAVGIWETGLGLARAGARNNPIHYGGMMVLLGFASLAGFEKSQSKWRYVFLLGPVLGLSGALLSGSRGPFLAAVALALALAPFYIAWNWRDRLFVLVLFLGSILSLLAFTLSPLGPRAAGGVLQLFEGSLSGDFSFVDVARSQLLQAAMAAFAESPVWGHGWANMMSAAEIHLPAESPYFGFDNLHADLADFAVLGGVLGLGAYLILIFAPLALLRAVPAEYRKSGIIVAVTVSVGFFVLGLTNAMFGVLPQTMLYTVLMGWLMCLVRKPLDAEQASDQSGLTD